MAITTKDYATSGTYRGIVEIAQLDCCIIYR